MELFEIAINIVESMLLVYFVHRVYKLKYDMWFVLAVSVLFIEEMISSYINSRNSIIMFVLPITLVIYQCIRFKRRSFNYVLIGAMSMLIVYFSNVLSLFIIQIICGLDIGEYLNIAIVLSKTLCLLLMYYSSSHTNIGEDEVLHIWQFNLVVALLLIIIDIDMQGIIDLRETGMEVYIRILIIGMLIVLLYRFLEQLIESNNQKIYYELELQKLTYEKKNTKILEDSQKEIKRLDHNLKYTMMSILLHANTQNLDAIKEVANNYLGRLIMANHSVVTKNPYFDYMFNEMDLEYKLNHVILKKQIEILENSVINTTVIANQIIAGTKKFLDLAIDNKMDTVDIKIIEDGDFCFIYCLVTYVDYEAMKTYLENTFDTNYVYTFDTELHKVRISFSIDIE